MLAILLNCASVQAQVIYPDLTPLQYTTIVLSLRRSAFFNVLPFANLVAVIPVLAKETEPTNINAAAKNKFFIIL